MSSCQEAQLRHAKNFEAILRNAETLYLRSDESVQQRLNLFEMEFGIIMPSFFDPFSLTANFDFSLKRMPVWESGTLLHEYVHYWQAISTPYGIQRLFNWMQAGIILSELAGKTGKLKIPLQKYAATAEAPTEVVQATAEIIENRRIIDYFEYTAILPFNASPLPPLHFSEVDFFEDQQPHPVAFVPVKMRDAAYLCPLSGLTLQESMAQGVQNCNDQIDFASFFSNITPETLNYAAVPYFLFHQFPNQRRELWERAIVLCDIALNCISPNVVAYGLCSMLLKQPKLASLSPLELHSLLWKEWLDIFTDSYNEVQGKLDTLLARTSDTSTSLFSALHFLAEILQRALQQRFDDPEYFVRHMLSAPAELMAAYPLPRYFALGKLKSTADDPRYHDLGSMIAFMGQILEGIVWTGDLRCKLYQTENCDSPQSELCVTAPWRLPPDENNTLCEFGYMLDRMNFHKTILEYL